MAFSSHHTSGTPKRPAYLRKTSSWSSRFSTLANGPCRERAAQINVSPLCGWFCCSPQPNPLAWSCTCKPAAPAHSTFSSLLATILTKSVWAHLKVLILSSICLSPLRCFVARQLLLQIYALSSVKFPNLKLRLCKINDKYQVWPLPPHLWSINELKRGHPKLPLPKRSAPGSSDQSQSCREAPLPWCRWSSKAPCAVGQGPSLVSRIKNILNARYLTRGVPGRCFVFIFSNRSFGLVQFFSCPQTAL